MDAPLPSGSDLPLQNRQEANLVFFAHDRLSHALDYYSNLISPPQTAVKFAQNSLLESYLWLYWGVVVGYFPLQLSRRLVYEHFGSILRAYEAVLATREIETWFTQPLRIIFDAEFNGRRELFTSTGDWAKYSDELSSLFHAVFLIANGYALQSSASRLTQILDFAPDDLWKSVISETLSSDAVHMFGWGGENAPGPEQWALPGFFASLDFMEGFRAIPNDIQRQNMKPSNEFYDFLRLLKETQQWRLNFGYSLYRQRFLTVAEIAAASYAQQIQSAFDVRREFTKHIYELMTDWEAPRTKTAEV